MSKVRTYEHWTWQHTRPVVVKFCRASKYWTDRINFANGRQDRSDTVNIELAKTLSMRVSWAQRILYISR